MSLKRILQQFESYLWTAADILRDNMDTAECKDYTLGPMFLTRMSDRFNEGQTTVI